MMQIKNISKYAALAAAITLLCACSNFPWQAQVKQGHLISGEQLKQLKVGMTQTQVNYLLGAPDIKDPFHKGRWDYVYTSSYPTAPAKRLTLLFTGSRLTQIYGTYAGLTPKPLK
ncbi:cell envelope protein SmpA [Piscirickettsia salmonis]|nr:outer membrane protein assembly factor BamE [Piscirickettsia salmonis]RNC78876.1 outer membrane protein assembly factor BamE [Piscirickettsiaceae bacterium NZ-RLO2]APS44187.1 cell envelope protein SmpA [Piscirickettsia salmonis]APS47547.1 cell envelope protein SmpA [Piscirickettsia salmonis]APS51019.1 cell envelope protein SmpA [Piscirickettsia salmonis]APS54225.1 cell envelope protein SmpA [Piscirickettsia salmonis]